MKKVGENVMSNTETKYETCPRCGGSGMDNDTLDTICWHCSGTGEVKAKDKNNTIKEIPTDLQSDPEPSVFRYW